MGNQIIVQEEKTFANKLKSIFEKKNSKAISKTLELFEKGAITKQDAQILMEGMQKVQINVGGIKVEQSGYNCSFGGDAGHYTR